MADAGVTRQVLDAITVRFQAPLTSSILVSWLIINHRLLLTLLSLEKPVSWRFAYIDSVLYADPLWGFAKLVAFPIGLGCLWVRYYPGLARWSIKWTARHEAENANASKEGSGFRLVSVEDMNSMQLELSRNETKLRQMTAEREHERHAHQLSELGLNDQVEEAKAEVVRLKAIAAARSPDTAVEHYSNYLSTFRFMFIEEAPDGSVRDGESTTLTFERFSFGKGYVAMGRSSDRWSVRVSPKGTLHFSNVEGLSTGSVRFQHHTAEFVGKMASGATCTLRPMKYLDRD